MFFMKGMGSMKSLMMDNKGSIVKGVVFGKHLMDEMKSRKGELSKEDKMAIMKAKIKAKKTIMKAHTKHMNEKNKESKY